jgi:hypothetical protein
LKKEFEVSEGKNIQVRGKALPMNTKGNSWQDQDKVKLNRALAQVCALQRQYGKSPSELSTLVEGFAWALSPYPIAKVIEAIGKYILMRPDIPTPSDIKNIIDPPKPEWSPDWAFYSSLKKMKDERGGYAVDNDEIEYINACERHSLNRMKRSRE